MSYFTIMLVFILYISVTTTTTASGGRLNPTVNNNNNKSTSNSELDPALLTYKLSMQWPRAYCKTKSSGCKGVVIGDLPRYFTLHGLWPIYKGICNDSTEKFDVNKIRDMQNRLETYWPNLKAFGKKSMYASFWGHEWDFHGFKCNIFSVHSYFSQTLDLLANISSHVQQTLGLTGTRKPLTTAKEVKEAFKGKEPYVYCKYGRDDQTYYFYQIEFCLDSKKEYYNCPTRQQVDFCKDNQTFSYGNISVIGTNGFIFLP